MYYIGCAMRGMSSADHLKCDKFPCQVVQKSIQNFKAQHVTDRCQCELVGPRKDEVVDAIRRNLVPVICYSQETGLNVECLRLEDTSRSPYIAISHVWSDGLGDPNDNLIHVCQIRLMQERVHSLSKRLTARAHFNPNQRPLFWIDAFCVPAVQCVEKAAAIASIETVYREASAVLVLDSKLEALDNASPPANIAIAVALSRWITRMWTIEEAAFAKELFFQLRAEDVSQSELLSGLGTPSSANETLWNAQRVIATDSLTTLSQLSIDKMRSCQGRYF